MNTANVHAGRLERRVRLVGRETMPGVLGFCSLPLLSIRRNARQAAYCALRPWIGVLGFDVCWVAIEPQPNLRR